MKLIVNWQNCNRPPAERIEIERRYGARLTELCGDVNKAKLYHDEHVRLMRPPASAWSRFNAVAIVEATSPLLPSERRDAKFSVRFEV